MTASADQNLKRAQAPDLKKPVGADQTVYRDCLIDLVSGLDATAADRGDFVLHDSGSNRIPYGMARNSNVLSASGVQGFDGINSVAGDGSLVTVAATVGAGGANSVSVGEWMYAADDASFSLTRAAQDRLEGMVVRAEGTTAAQILWLGGAVAQRLVELAYQGHQLYEYFVTGNPSIATTYKITVPAHCELVSVEAVVVDPLSTGSAALSWSTTAGAVTGGTATWASTDAAGVALTVAAVTRNANTIVHEAQVLNLIVTPTSSADGLLAVRAKVRARAGF